MAKGLRWQYGAWQARVRIHGQNHATSFKFANSDAGLRKAISAREGWIAQLTHGERRYDSTLPFGNLAQAFLDQTDVKPSTGYSYKQILNQYWMPTLATKPRDSGIAQCLAENQEERSDPSPLGIQAGPRGGTHCRESGGCRQHQASSEARHPAFHALRKDENFRQARG